MPVTAAASGLSYIQATGLQRTGQVGRSGRLLAGAGMGKFFDFPLEGSETPALALQVCR